MLEELQKKFFPRFAKLAQERIVEGRRIAHDLEGEGALHVARQLHSLAGEAGLLGLTDLVVIARAAEEAATQLHAERSPAMTEGLVAALGELETALGKIEIAASSR